MNMLFSRHEIHCMEMYYTMTTIKVLSGVCDNVCDGWTKRHTYRTARYGKRKACSFIPPPPSPSSPPSPCRRSSTAHPELSGLNQGNRWETNGFCLAHMREGDTLIRASVVGFAQRAAAVTSTFSLLPPLPLYLPFYLRNVGMHWGQGRRDAERRGCREGKDKGERMESLGADRPALQADTFLLSPGGLEPQWRAVDDSHPPGHPSSLAHPPSSSALKSATFLLLGVQ